MEEAYSKSASLGDRGTNGGEYVDPEYWHKHLNEPGLQGNLYNFHRDVVFVKETFEILICSTQQWVVVLLSSIDSACTSSSTGIRASPFLCPSMASAMALRPH